MSFYFSYLCLVISFIVLITIQVSKTLNQCLSHQPPLLYTDLNFQLLFQLGVLWASQIQYIRSRPCYLFLCPIYSYCWILCLCGWHCHPSRQQSLPCLHPSTPAHQVFASYFQNTSCPLVPMHLYSGCSLSLKYFSFSFLKIQISSLLICEAYLRLPLPINYFSLRAPACLLFCHNTYFTLGHFINSIAFFNAEYNIRHCHILEGRKKNDFGQDRLLYFLAFCWERWAFYSFQCMPLKRRYAQQFI